MAPHSSTLAWRIPWTEEPGRLQSMGSLESDTTERLHFHFSLSCIGEGNGNPLQYSCLENPRDGKAWWAAVYGVAQSWTQLKWLSRSSKGFAWGAGSKPRLIQSQNPDHKWQLCSWSECEVSQVPLQGSIPLFSGTQLDNIPKVLLTSPSARATHQIKAKQSRTGL